MADKIATREAYGRALVALADKYPFVVLDADLSQATKTCLFAKEHPDRFFDCGMLNFLISPADLAARRWDGVRCYLHSA